MKALLAEGSSSAMLPMRSLLERKGWECHTVRSLREVRDQLAGQAFDLLVSSIHLPDGGVMQTIPLLEGSHCSAFFAFPVEQSCLWIPAVDHGRNCLGAATLGPQEFRKELDGILDGRQ